MILSCRFLLLFIYGNWLGTGYERIFGVDTRVGFHLAVSISARASDARLIMFYAAQLPLFSLVHINTQTIIIMGVKEGIIVITAPMFNIWRRLGVDIKLVVKCLKLHVCRWRA